MAGVVASADRDERVRGDPRKAGSNLKKHGVSFEALTVFSDPAALIFDDPDDTGAERREIIVGHSRRPRLLLWASRSAQAGSAAGGAPTVAVVLEPDVARVFGSSFKVNQLLRSVIKAVPGTAAAQRKRKAG